MNKTKQNKNGRNTSDVHNVLAISKRTCQKKECDLCAAQIYERAESF